MLGGMILLQLYATSSHAHRAPEANHTIRRSFGSQIVYLSADEQNRLNILWVVFGVSFVGGSVIAIMRGDIRGKR